MVSVKIFVSATKIEKIQNTENTASAAILITQFRNLHRYLVIKIMILRIDLLYLTLIILFYIILVMSIFNYLTL